MVQLRASLETLVLQAWRERWTELEWSINLKAALAQDSSELNKLCGLLLKQATLSEVPNNLMFGYLNYILAAQVVPHSSLLEAIVAYKDFNRELCIQSILDLLNFVRDRLRCNSSDTFECYRLCTLLTSLIGWLLTALETALVTRNQNLLNELVTTLLALTHNPFATVCIYFEQLENPAELESHIARLTPLLTQMSEADWVADMFKSDFRNLCHKLSSVPQLLSASQSSLVDLRELNPSVSHGSVLSLVSVYGSCRLSQCLSSLTSHVRAMQSALRLPWWLMMRDLIRAALLIQHDPAQRESSVTAFVYLKIPRVLSCLLETGDVGEADIRRAIEHVASYHSLLNSLDMKTRSNNFHNLLEEFKKLNLCSDSSMTSLMEIRNRDKPSFTDISPGSQGGVTLILKASGTVQTLERSFNLQEFALKPDKLVQMMSHMITGKSFDYICASSAAMSKLSDFTRKLMEFNGNAERPSTLQGAEHRLRATMFDLSFLLLSRIKSLYSDLDVNDSRNAFFERWTRQYAEPTAGNNGNTKESPDTESDLVSGHLASLKDGKQFWDIGNCDWSDVCFQLPAIGRLVLEELKQKRISDQQLKVVFTVLQSDVCGLVLCVAQWLCVSPPSDERTYLASALQAFIDTPLGEKRSHAHPDRWNFVSTTVRPVLDTVLQCAPQRSPAYSWLQHCGRRQLPRLTAFETPNDDDLTQAFIYSLRQGWTSPNVLALINRSAQRWCSVWLHELLKLMAVEQMGLGVELCLGAAMLSPCEHLLTLCRLVSEHVFGAGNELYCVSPRGVLLARFLVQAYVLALQLQDNGAVGSCNEEPKPKVRRMDENQKNEPSPTLQAIDALYRQFGSVCDDGEVRPAVRFVASYLRALAEHNGDAAKQMVVRLPSTLISQLIRTDPKVLPASTVLSLHNMNDQNQRRKALQNLCLLRQMRAL